MINYIKADFLKQKHRFTMKLLWIGPVVTMALIMVIMQGRYFVEDAFNWWSTMLLPGSLAMIIVFSNTAEKKWNRHGFFNICVDKKKMWISQIIMNVMMLFLLNAIFYAVMLATGLFFGLQLHALSSATGCVILILTYAWQIPVMMILSEKCGSLTAIIISMICNMGFGIFFAPTKMWMIPFSIPARLLCPVVKVMPNGIPLEASHPLCNSDVILPGILITAMLFVIFSVFTTLWFQRREVK